jgi:hypothetical protein
MPHSKTNRKQIDKRRRTIDSRLKFLQRIHLKESPSVRSIRLPFVSLGELRAKFSPRNKPLDPSVLEASKHFRRIPRDPLHPLSIYGSDGGLLAYRSNLKDDDMVQTLTDSLAQLPSRTNLKFRGVYRGTYSTRHYCVWSPYQRTPFVSKELQQDGEAGLSFLDSNRRLWKRISDILGQISPGTYRRFLRYPLPRKLKRFCTAFAGCVVNLGDQDPVQTAPHRDVKESIYGYSCIVPAGDYSGGALILFDLKLVVELGPGDVFFFPDSLIHHANEEVRGNRSSIVAFTQENLFHYWTRKYKYINPKH